MENKIKLYTVLSSGRTLKDLLTKPVCPLINILPKSKTEIKRLIDQGSVWIIDDLQKVKVDDYYYLVKDGDVVKYGRKFLRCKVAL
jgi:hypothetical protein